MDVMLNDVYQIIEKTVSPGGNSGRVYVPREWIGKRVKIVLIDSIEHQEGKLE